MRVPPPPPPSASWKDQGLTFLGAGVITLSRPCYSAYGDPNEAYWAAGWFLSAASRGDGHLWIAREPDGGLVGFFPGDSVVGFTSAPQNPHRADVGTLDCSNGVRITALGQFVPLNR